MGDIPKNDPEPSVFEPAVPEPGVAAETTLKQLRYRVLEAWQEYEVFPDQESHPVSAYESGRSCTQSYQVAPKSRWFITIDLRAR